MKLRPLLLICVLLAGVLPMAIVSYVINHQASQTMTRTTYDRLQASVARNQLYVQNALDTVRHQNAVLARNQTVVAALKGLDQGITWLENDAYANEQEREQANARLAGFYQRYIEERLPETLSRSLSVDDLMPQDEFARIVQRMVIVESSPDLDSKEEVETLPGESHYGYYHGLYHDTFAANLRRFGYEDLYLIESFEGTVVYSVKKRIDFATALWEGPHRDSALAEVARAAQSLDQGETAITDFSFYVPNHGRPAAFVATPVFEKQKRLGILVFQLPAARMSEMMAQADGLGDSGEVFLLGSDGLMRSDTRLSGTPTTLLKQISLDTLQNSSPGRASTREAELDGTDYLLAHVPIAQPGLDWHVVARMRRDEALSAVRSLLRTGISMAGLAILMVIAMAFLLSGRIHRMLGADPSELSDIARDIGAGRLVPRGKPGSSTGGAAGDLHRMRNSLSSVIENASRMVEDVTRGTKQVLTGAQGLEQRTEQQLALLEETAVSTQELADTVEANARSAETANELAADARRRADDSGEVAERALQGMQNISDASEQIADITGLIEEIASQTNLLALNAAVEAARAGHEGRGFAVVANEVRALANRSSEAASQIKHLIEQTALKIEDGTDFVQQSSAQLNHIAKAIVQLSELAGDITLAGHEQTQGIKQLNRSLLDIETMSRENAALIADTANTSAGMSSGVDSLHSQMAFFTVSDTLPPRDAGDSPSLHNSPC